MSDTEHGVVCHVCYNHVTDDQHRHTLQEVSDQFRRNLDAGYYGKLGDRWQTERNRPRTVVRSKARARS